MHGKRHAIVRDGFGRGIGTDQDGAQDAKGTHATDFGKTMSVREPVLNLVSEA